MIGVAEVETPKIYPTHWNIIALLLIIIILERWGLLGNCNRLWGRRCVRLNYKRSISPGYALRRIVSTKTGGRPGIKYLDMYTP